MLGDNLLHTFKRVLITGGAGFIGSNMVDRFLNDGYEITILDNLSTGNLENIRPYLENENFHFIKGDLRDKRALKEALKDVETVFHLAAITSVPFSVKNPEITHNININGTKNILEISIRENVKRFIHASTCAVYGDPIYLPIDEQHPINPKSPYADTKLKAEKICMEYKKAYGLKTTILRLFNVYGPRQKNGEYSGVIVQFIDRLRKNKPPLIYGDGSQTRDFVHVDDVIQAFALAMNKVNYEETIFNIASGKPTSLNQLAKILIDLYGDKEIKPIYLKPREGDIKQSYADIKKAEAILEYKPCYTLKKELSNLNFYNKKV
jgi:UDP-glucose 4-epimerase